MQTYLKLWIPFLCLAPMLVGCDGQTHPSVDVSDIFGGQDAGQDTEDGTVCVDETKYIRLDRNFQPPRALNLPNGDFLLFGTDPYEPDPALGYQYWFGKVSGDGEYLGHASFGDDADELGFDVAIGEESFFITGIRREAGGVEYLFVSAVPQDLSSPTWTLKVGDGAPEGGGTRILFSGENLLIAGFLIQAPGGPPYYDLRLTKVTTTGEMLWDRRITEIGHQTVAAVSSDSEGGAFIATQYMSPESPLDSLSKVFRFSSEAEVLWEITLSTPDYSTYVGAAVSIGTGVLLGGSQDRSPYLWMLDADGDVSWSTPLNGIGHVSTITTLGGTTFVGGQIAPGISSTKHDAFYSILNGQQGGEPVAAGAKDKNDGTIGISIRPDGRITLLADTESIKEFGKNIHRLVFAGFCP